MLHLMLKAFEQSIHMNHFHMTQHICLGWIFLALFSHNMLHICSNSWFTCLTRYRLLIILSILLQNQTTCQEVKYLSLLFSGGLMVLLPALVLNIHRSVLLSANLLSIYYAVLSSTRLLLLPCGWSCY